jgi:hypothetical protein
MAFRENYSREMHFPEGKLFPSAGIGEIRQASGVTAAAAAEFG